MEIAPDLIRRLKRLRRGGLRPTRPDRMTQARQAKLSPLECLALLLQDEIDRRDRPTLTLRLAAASFEEEAPLEQVLWDSPVSVNRTGVRELFSLHGLAQRENVCFTGPVGVGKRFLACALGQSACRAGARVRLVTVARLLHALPQSRADHSFARELRRGLTPDLLILDDFGLHTLTAQQSSDVYDVLVERHGRASTIIPSHRAVDEWVARFDDPTLANRARDRVAHRAHQIVMEGPSLRAARAPSTPNGVNSGREGGELEMAEGPHVALRGVQTTALRRSPRRSPEKGLARPGMTEPTLITDVAQGVGESS